MFSPKVLDRANVIEFKINGEEMEYFLNSSTALSLSGLKGLGGSASESFIKIVSDTNVLIESSSELTKVLMDFFNELKKTGAEFGYRSAFEILRFGAVINKIEPEWTLAEIIDAAVMQKLLPKVHGSRRKLEPILKTLGTLCLASTVTFDDILSPKSPIDFSDSSKIKYPLSLEKILRMHENLISNGFTSYAEA